MNMFGEPDPLRVVRTTATLERERVRQRAAQRLATPFMAAALPLLFVGGLLSARALTHGSERLAQGVGLVAMLVAIGLILIGGLRSVAYLKSHLSDV